MLSNSCSSCASGSETDGNGGGGELDRLRAENARLRKTVEDSESRLDELQSGVVQLQDEYRSESEDLQDQVAELTRLVEEQETEAGALKAQLEKAVRAKTGLESYLQTLPSTEEHDAVRMRVRARDEECSRLNLRLAELKGEVESAKRDVR